MKYIITFLFLPFLVLAQNKGASPIGTKTESIASGTTYAVVVGISDYQDKDIPDLRFAYNETELIASYLRFNEGGNLDNDQFKLRLVYALYKRYPGSVIENEMVIQRNTKNTIAYNNLSRSLRFGNKGNEALNVLHNG